MPRQERLFFRNLPGRAGYAYLPTEGRPEEEQGDVVILFHLVRLGAFQIGEKHEAAVIEVFKQYGARRRSSLVVHRRDAHGIGVERIGFACFAEP